MAFYSAKPREDSGFTHTRYPPFKVNPSMYRIHDVDDVRHIARRAVAGAAVMGLTMSPYAQAVPPT